MSAGHTLLLGAIAGMTIYLGLPIGRLPRVDARPRVALTMCSVGLLAFIFMDVTSHAQALIEPALERLQHHQAGVLPVVGRYALLAVAFIAGTTGIAISEQRLRSRTQRRLALTEGVAATEGGGAPASLEHPGRREALAVGMSIAAAIGLHNFAEGLAIGVAAKAGAVGLATVLIVGFALHNATEGFGIVGPLAGVRPSWRWLGVAGLVGGGPTFLGTIVGYQVRAPTLQLLFYALAGGAIIYVIGEIWAAARRLGHRTLGLNLLALGFLLGVATDLIVTYGGA